MGSKSFVFDFDGVLFDTAPECLRVAFDTASRQNHKWGFPQSWKPGQKISQDVLVPFLKNRAWVGPPWQYGPLLLEIFQGEISESREAFLAKAQTLRESFQGFEDSYFATRIELQKNTRLWLAEVKPYPEALAAFEAAKKRDLASILSTRDSDSISKIIQYFIDEPPDPRIILPRASKGTKSAVLEHWAAPLKIARSNVVFIDDYVEHLLPAHRDGFNCRWASWGYTQPEDLDLCTQSGIRVLTQRTLLDEVQKEVSV